MLLRYKIAALMAVALIVGVAFNPFEGNSTLSPMTLERRSGRVEVVRGDERVVVDDRFDIEPGDVILTGDGSLAKLQLAKGRLLWLGGGRVSRSTVVDTDTLTSETGSVLGVASAPLKVKYRGVTAMSREGVFRVDLGFGSARAASYEGDLDLKTAGSPSVEVEPLFQAAVVAGRLRAERPYRLDSSDVWDRQLLSKVIALQEDLDALANALRDELRGDPPGLTFFSGLADQPVDFMKPYLRSRTISAIDLIMGFTVADHAESRPLPSAVNRAFDLYGAGAQWGIAAAILDAEFRPVVAQLENVILDSGVVVASEGEPTELTLAVEASVSGDAPPPPGNEPIDPTKPKDPDPKDPDDPDPDDPDEPEDCQDGAQCDVNDAKEFVEEQIPPVDDPPGGSGSGSGSGGGSGSGNGGGSEGDGDGLLDLEL